MEGHPQVSEAIAVLQHAEDPVRAYIAAFAVPVGRGHLPRDQEMAVGAAAQQHPAEETDPGPRAAANRGR
jgi:hypothetical protein